MSTLKVDTILKRTGTGTITLGQSGDTLAIPSGVTIANSGSATGFGANTPLWKVWRSGNQSMSTGADTKIPFNTWSLDDDSILDASNNRVVPAVAGKYFIIAQITMDTSTDFNMLYLDIRISGSNKSNAQVKHDHNGSVTVSLIDNLSATDYIECFGMQNSGGNLNMMGGVQNTWMQGFKLI